MASFNADGVSLASLELLRQQFAVSLHKRGYPVQITHMETVREPMWDSLYIRYMAKTRDGKLWQFIVKLTDAQATDMSTWYGVLLDSAVDNEHLQKFKALAVLES